MSVVYESVAKDRATHAKLLAQNRNGAFCQQSVLEAVVLDAIEAGETVKAR